MNRRSKSYPAYSKNRWDLIKENILRSPLLLMKGLKYHLSGRVFLPRPVFFGLGVTNQCNARCIMCPVWTLKDDKQPTIDKIKEIFSNPVLSNLKILTLTGGEPFLRPDIPEILQLALDVNPSIQWVSINSNGLDSFVIEQKMKEMLSLPLLKRLKTFLIQVSVDGYEEVHDRIRGIPNAFEAVKETLSRLKKLQSMHPFNIEICSVVQKLNIENLPLLSEYARQVDIPIRFNPVENIGFSPSYFKQKLALTPSQQKLFESYIDGVLKNDFGLTFRIFWREYFKIIGGEKRGIPCALPYYSLFMGGEGNLFICGKDDSLIYGNIQDQTIDQIWRSKHAQQVRKNCINNICPTCGASCLLNVSLGEEVFFFTKWLIKSFLTANEKSLQSRT